MANRQQLTLSTLLSLKQRRERSIRSAIAQLSRRQAELGQQRQQVQQQRQQLWQLWHHCGEGEQVLDYSQWQCLKRELADFYLQDQDLLDRAHRLEQMLNQLQSEQVTQQQLLRQALLEQEKLKFLLE